MRTLPATGDPSPLVLIVLVRAGAGCTPPYLAYTVCAILQKQIGTTFGVGRFAISKLVSRDERRLGPTKSLRC